MRVLAENPTDQKTLLLKAISELRAAVIGGTKALEKLSQADDTSTSIKAAANYELGIELWSRGKPESAFQYLKKAFLYSNSNDIFLKSGYVLALLIKEEPRLADKSSELAAQLKTCSSLWKQNNIRAPRSISRKHPEAITGKPGQWLISFYRAQIAPAIGQRCSLHPSCSEYARQAFRKHGLLGFAIFGDRAFREPDVVADMNKSVIINGQLRYVDLLNNHDWWIKQ